MRCLIVSMTSMHISKSFQYYYYFLNHFSSSIQIIKTHNVIEYVNNEFGEFLSGMGILHKFCVMIHYFRKD